MAASGLVITSDTLTPGLRRFPDVANRQIAQTIDYFSPRVEGYARDNAPWTDRTGNARTGLRARPQHESRSHSIVVFHSVPYGIWLEIRFEGRYAIILPTVQIQGRELMAFMKGLFGRMK